MFLYEQINKLVDGWGCVYIIDFGVYYTNRLDLMINACTFWISGKKVRVFFVILARPLTKSGTRGYCINYHAL